MPFDWSEFLAVARHLQGQSGPGYSEEAANRTAISRAYYAVFGRVCEFAEANLGFRRAGSGRDHRSLREHLYHQGGQWPAIADDLNDLRQWRNLCDYGPDVQNLQILVMDAIRRAEQILRQI